MATAALTISSRHYATKEMLVTTTCNLFGPSSSYSSNMFRKVAGSMSGGFGTCCSSHRSYSSLMHDHRLEDQRSSRNGSSIPIQTNNYSTSKNNKGKGSLSSIKSDTESILYKFSHEPQTAISLQTLMRTGRGEFLHKHWKDEDTPNNNAGQHQHSSTSSDSDVDDDDGSKVATERVLIQVAGFLRRELPIRLAHRVNDLQSMPIFSDMPSAMTVRDLYINSFMDLISVPKHISNKQEEEAFARLVEGIYERHASVLVIMARAAYEFRDAQRKKKGMNGATTTPAAGTNNSGGNGNGGAVEYEDMEDLHAFLDRFYVSRIGIRVLIGQYLALRQPYMENYVGIICSKTSPFEIVLQAIDDASFMCARKYGDAPEVIITGRKDLTFPYVPTHLHYIMLELIKNSMRATVDWHGVDSDYPPIKVVIADGKDNEDVVIKVSDEGGGIPRSNMKRIWSYLFTTADPEVQEGIVEFNSDNVDHSIDSPLAGLGYGLPISRSYARYFGGDLSIMSMEGYGTDAFVYLTRLGTSREPLPI